MVKDAEFLSQDEIDALLDIAEQSEVSYEIFAHTTDTDKKELKSLKVLRLLKDYPIFAENQMLIEECIKELENL